MKCCLMLAVALLISGCGVETAGVAATGAAVKKEEIEQGRKTMEQMQQKLDQANLQVQQRAGDSGGEK